MRHASPIVYRQKARRGIRLNQVRAYRLEAVDTVGGQAVKGKRPLRHGKGRRGPSRDLIMGGSGMLTLEYKLKRAALRAAVDITLRGKEQSPGRCARNLLELGCSVNPQLSKEQKNSAYNQLLTACRNQGLPECKELFFSLFFLQQS